MAENKFNPIAKLPILPGAEIVDDEVVSNTIDSTYPPVEKTTPESKNQKIEIRIKPTEPNKPSDDDKNKSRHLMAVRTIILVALIVLILFGIFLTLSFVPKIAGNVSNFSKTFTSLFTSNKTANPVSTNNPKIPATIALVATSTPKTSGVAATNYSTTTQTTVAPKPKTAAKLVAEVMTTTTAGSQTVVRFNIQNVGGSPTGPWSFIAALPSTMTPTYYSEPQSSLSPFSGVVYTLSFTADQYQYQNQYQNQYPYSNQYPYQYQNYQYQNSYPYQYQNYQAPIQITTYLNGVSSSNVGY